jgi:anti-sigma B factor antagonist
MPDGRFPVTTANGIPVVATPEEVDITNAEDLRAAILEAENAGNGTLIVDMTRTHFCDSAGLHTLVRAYKRAQEQDGELLLAVSGTAVKRILELTGLDTRLPVFPTLDHALAAARMDAGIGFHVDQPEWLPPSAAATTLPEWSRPTRTAKGGLGGSTTAVIIKCPFLVLFGRSILAHLW